MAAEEGLAAVIFGVYRESLRRDRTKNYLFQNISFSRKEDFDGQIFDESKGLNLSKV